MVAFCEEGGGPLTHYSIRSYFAEKSVLVTGFTGFLGKVLVEKLLHDLPELRRVFILIRPQTRGNGAGKGPEERLRDELERNPVFERLRRDWGSRFESFCRERIVCLPGDLTVERLGLEPEAYSALAGSLDVIIGSAAVVSFDERLDIALAVNALGPLRLMELAGAARSPYIHISTAFVSGNRRGVIDESLTEPIQAMRGQSNGSANIPLHFDVTGELAYLEEICRNLLGNNDCRRVGPNDTDESAVGAVARKQLAAAGMQRARELGWNDTYTYTKFLGEHVVRLHRGQIPTLVVRPSIIESSLRDPVPGWIEGLRVTDPLIISFGKGRLDYFPTRRDVVIDLIPVDFVANAILAGTAALGTEPGTWNVIHVTSSAVNPIRIGDLYEAAREYFAEHPFYDGKGKPISTPIWEFPTMYRFRRHATRLQRRLRVAEAIARASAPFPWGPRALARQRLRRSDLERLLHYVDLYGAYANLDCRFDASSALALARGLPEDERGTFDFDPRTIDWTSYIKEIHIPGLRRNVLRDEARLPPRPGPDAMITEAQRGGGRGRANSLAARVLNTTVLPREVERALEPTFARTLLRGAVSVAMKTIFHTWIHIECEGRDRLPKAGPCILVANHTSHLDTAVIREAVGELASELYVMAARDYFFDARIKAWFFSAAFNTLPFERKNRTLLSLTLCRRVLEKRRALLIYPEGGRSKTGVLQPFKPGIGILALELGHPVVPLHIRGTFESLPPGARIPRQTRVRVRCGRPLYPRDLLGPPSKLEASDECRRGRPADRCRYRLAAERIQAAVASLEGAP